MIAEPQTPRSLADPLALEARRARLVDGRGLAAQPLEEAA